jgi:hypothetical protein
MANKGWSRALQIAGMLALALLPLLGLRFRHNPYWIEAHGQGLALDIAASHSGVFAIGGSQTLYSYPGPWAQPWAPQAGKSLLALASNGSQLLAVTTGGGLQWLNPRSGAVAGTAELQLSRAALSAERGPFVLAGHTVSRFHDGKLESTPCSTLAAEDLAAADWVWVVSQGALYRDDEHGCERQPATPPAVSSVAAWADRVAVVTADGRGWQRVAGRWRELPVPEKRRVDAITRPMSIRRLALGETTTYALDSEGAVFLLSEQL